MFWILGTLGVSLLFFLLVFALLYSAFSFIDWHEAFRELGSLWAAFEDGARPELEE